MLYKPFYGRAIMHHASPDLSLASSYIPACLCLGKSLAAFILFLFSPQRGWVALACLLSVDRILWNHASHLLLMDASAVCSAMVGGLMVVRTRGDGGIHSDLQYVVVAPWLLLSALQMVGVTRVPRAYEIVVAACAVSVLSCTHQRPDENEVTALRAFAFVFANILMSYVGVVVDDYDATSYVSVSRTLPILLGEWHVAVAWAVVYLMCLGHQLRGGRRGAAKASPEDACEVAQVVPSSAVANKGGCSEEAGLLREALARKGFTPSGV